MSNLPIHPHTLSVPLAAAMGLLAFSGGVYGLINPLAWSGGMGVTIPSSPTTNSQKSPALAFASFTAARNLGVGLSTLALLYSGQRKAVGLSIICGVAVAELDAWVCSQYGREEGKAIGHAVMGVLAGVLGVVNYVDW